MAEIVVPGLVITLGTRICNKIAFQMNFKKMKNEKNEKPNIL